MRHEVTLRGARGEREIVFVEASDGDDAAAKAFKPHMVVLSVQPAPVLELTDVVQRRGAK